MSIKTAILLFVAPIAIVSSFFTGNSSDFKMGLGILVIFGIGVLVSSLINKEDRNR